MKKKEKVKPKYEYQPILEDVIGKLADKFDKSQKEELNYALRKHLNIKPIINPILTDIHLSILIEVIERGVIPYVDTSLDYQTLEIAQWGVESKIDVSLYCREGITHNQLLVILMIIDAKVDVKRLWGITKDPVALMELMNYHLINKK